MQEAPFFRGWGGSWDTPYGRFFLGWYSRALLDHGERLVALATSVFTAAAPARCTLSNHAAPERSIAGAGPAYGIPGLLPAGGGETDPAASAGPSIPTGSDRSSGGGAPERARGGPAEAAPGGGAGERGAGGARGGEGPAGFAAAGPGSRAISRSPSGLSAMSTSTSASTLDAGSEVRVFIICQHQDLTRTPLQPGQHAAGSAREPGSAGRSGGAGRQVQGPELRGLGAAGAGGRRARACRWRR